MGNGLVYNKEAMIEFDKVHKDPGEAWGKNKLSFVDHNHLEEGTACLDEAAATSQLMEGDKYVTSSLVVPVAYRLMANSATGLNAFFNNRNEDELNDNDTNPVIVPHADLQGNIQEAREAFHEWLVDRFDSSVPMDVETF
jgi:hypothetical protein